MLPEDDRCFLYVFQGVFQPTSGPNAGTTFRPGTGQTGK